MVFKKFVFCHNLTRRPANWCHMIAFEPNPSMLNTAATCNANKNETKYMLMFFIAAIKRSNSNYLASRSSTNCPQIKIMAMDQELFQVSGQ
jgi:hypothetical protein